MGAMASLERQMSAGAALPPCCSLQVRELAVHSALGQRLPQFNQHFVKSRGTQAQSQLLVKGSLVLQKAAKIAVNALIEAGSKAQEHRKEESLPSDERS